MTMTFNLLPLPKLLVSVGYGRIKGLPVSDNNGRFTWIIQYFSNV